MENPIRGIGIKAAVCISGITKPSPESTKPTRLGSRATAIAVLPIEFSERGASYMIWMQATQDPLTKAMEQILKGHKGAMTSHRDCTYQRTPLAPTSRLRI